MKVAYYPGCSLHSTGFEYDLSMRMVCEAMDIGLVELPGWTCCGSSPAHQYDELMSLALPARNLAMIRLADGLKEVCAPCASCYSRLKFAQAGIAGDKETGCKVKAVIGQDVPDDVKVLSALELFEKAGLDLINQKIVRSLSGVKVACYYGCLLTRPPEITVGDGFENPTAMEAIMEAAGAQCPDWNLKTFCCGAAFALTQTDVVLTLTNKVLADATGAGAEAVCVACPLCHANLDGRQKQINNKFGTDFSVPVFYFTELLGLALGIDAGRMGLFSHITDVRQFLAGRNLL